MSGTQVETRAPLGVSAKDDEPKGFCEVICVIPELKVSTSLSGVKLTKKPADGALEQAFKQRSFSFTVGCKSQQKKPVKYSFSVSRLPGDIIPEQSKIKLKEGKVILKLKKAESGPWDLMKGIETAEDEEAGDE